MELRIRGSAWREQDRQAKLSNWHTWFAWYPVRLGEFEVVWLERLKRKGKFYEGAGHYWWQWEYAHLPPLSSSQEE